MHAGWQNVYLKTCSAVKPKSFDGLSNHSIREGTGEIKYGNHSNSDSDSLNRLQDLVVNNPDLEKLESLLNRF